MGLFGNSKKKSSPKPRVDAKAIQEQLYRTNVNYRRTVDAIAYQNKLIARVNAARERYKNDGNLDAIIKEYEFAFVESNPPCTSSQYIKLADFYIKAGQNDKAWGYLNSMLAKKPNGRKDIRFAQARILKKEKRYMDAIEMYMLGYLANAERNNSFSPNTFKREIQPCINKLQWEADTADYLCYLLESQIKKKNYRESTVINSYRAFVGSQQKS